MKKYCIIGFSALVLASAVQAQVLSEKQLLTLFIMAEDGDTLHIPAGTYRLQSSLSLEGKRDVVVLGEGMDETIFDFSGQLQGAEGIRVENCQRIGLAGFTVRNAKGDAVKTIDVDGISFEYVKAVWTGKPSGKNGAYGLYPVSCRKVLIANCIAIGASDAGIYVGQSKGIVVRNCEAAYNVAGIEIENSLDAEVFDNLAHHNTGGILVFDLPGLVQKKGGNVKVYRNEVTENNYRNFAPKGNMVGFTPAGSGIIVLGTSAVEIFDNTITENKTLGVAIASYHVTELPLDDKAYDPFPKAIFVHDNTFTRSKRLPTLQHKLGLLLFKHFKREVPQIMVDGIWNADLLNSNATNYKGDQRICIRNNKGITHFVNMNLGKGIQSPLTNAVDFDCEQTLFTNDKSELND